MEIIPGIIRIFFTSEAHLEVSPPPHSKLGQAEGGSSAGLASAGGWRPGRRAGSLITHRFYVSRLLSKCQHFLYKSLNARSNFSGRKVFGFCQ